MQHRSLVFLIVVFSLCSADLFLFSGVSSRPAGAVAIYNLVLGSHQFPDQEAIAWTSTTHATPNNDEMKPVITVAYHGKHANNSRRFDRLANISK